MPSMVSDVSAMFVAIITYMQIVNGNDIKNQFFSTARSYDITSKVESNICSQYSLTIQGALLR